MYTKKSFKNFSDKIKNASNGVLVILMIMAVYSHYMVNDKFERIAPALVIIILYFEIINIKLINQKLYK